MAIPTAPRSVTDATRFTAQTPHATAKAPSTRKLPASRRTAAANESGRGSKFQQETPEERVARLRRAHLAVKNAQLSTLDRVANRVRPMLDTAHRITVLTLIGFTGVAAMVTVYTAFDMLAFNRKRKRDFFALAAQAEKDSVSTARIAYVRGEATEEQTKMVEELQAKAHKSGVKLPPIFQEDGVTPRTLKPEAAKWIGKASPAHQNQEQEDTTPSRPERHKSFKEWALGTLRREEEGEDIESGESRLGYESLCEEDDVPGVRESDIVKAVEEKQAWEREKARKTLEKKKNKERDNHGAGAEAEASKKVEGGLEEVPKTKKGWWLW